MLIYFLDAVTGKIVGDFVASKEMASSSGKMEPFAAKVRKIYLNHYNSGVYFFQNSTSGVGGIGMIFDEW